jgi:hypothetical protein
VAIPHPAIEELYVDPTAPERACDYCGKPYRGAMIYCSPECAQLAGVSAVPPKNGDENDDSEADSRELDDGVEPDEPDDDEDYAEEPAEPPEHDMDP